MALLLLLSLCLCYNAVNSCTPMHLSNLFHLLSIRLLRSAFDTLLLKLPLYKCKSKGDHAFSYAGPAVWNSLPFSIRNSTSIQSFNSSLKFKNLPLQHSSVWLGYLFCSCHTSYHVHVRLCVCASVGACVCMCTCILDIYIDTVLFRCFWFDTYSKAPIALVRFALNKLWLLFWLLLLLFYHWTVT